MNLYFKNRRFMAGYCYGGHSVTWYFESVYYETRQRLGYFCDWASYDGMTGYFFRVDIQGQIILRVGGYSEA